jgi:lipocalin
MVSFTLGLLAASASTAAAGFISDAYKGLTSMTVNPATVAELDVPAYAGYWYQVR